jgi:hypothetical protein
MGVALRLLDQSARAWQYDEPRALSLTGDAVGLIGPAAVLAILELQGLGKLPACGTADWERLVSLADQGQVAIGTVLLIGDRDYVCDDRLLERIRQEPAAQPPPQQRPRASLLDELRDMDML